METRKAEQDTFRQPHHHHHHQILLPCHHQQKQNRLPCHHHHHHHHHHVVLLPHCCAVHGFVLPPNGPPVLRPIDPCTPHTITQLQPSFGDQDNQSSQVFEQEDAFEELEEEEEEEDPIFVLTDEWRDFFAKSEAKRRQAKKQARKQAKKRIKMRQSQTMQFSPTKQSIQISPI